MELICESRGIRNTELKKGNVKLPERLSWKKRNGRCVHLVRLQESPMVSKENGGHAHARTELKPEDGGERCPSPHPIKCLLGDITPLILLSLCFLPFICALVHGEMVQCRGQKVRLGSGTHNRANNTLSFSFQYTLWLDFTVQNGKIPSQMVAEVDRNCYSACVK